jgi:hypothetical protein
MFPAEMSENTTERFYSKPVAICIHGDPCWPLRMTKPNSLPFRMQKGNLGSGSNGWLGAPWGLKTKPADPDSQKVAGLRGAPPRMMSSPTSTFPNHLGQIENPPNPKAWEEQVSVTTPAIFCTYLSVFKVNLVSQYNKREIFRIPGTGLNEKLISPAIKSFERVGGSHVKHQNAAVCTSVEGHTKRLEPFLTGCVPDLQENICNLGDIGRAPEERENSYE